MKILIAGGGTGGHIYPALAIADALKSLDATTTVEFVGTPSGLENKLVPRAGYKLHFISVGRLNTNVGVVERLFTLLRMPFALLKAVWLTLRLNPDVVVGVGGYASGPFVLIASLMGKKAFIWEPNAYPGLANRILSQFVSECLVVFSEAAKFLKNKKIRQVHMPVRAEIENMKVQNPPTDFFRILVFGGSQGARAINSAVAEAVVKGGEWLRDIKIVHQTGALDFARIKSMYEQSAVAREHVEIFEYLHDMPTRYAQSHMVVARAGTGTISELAASQKAALLIPLPSAADDHQTKNAMALEAKNAARLLKQDELTSERLIKEIMFFKMNSGAVAEYAMNIRQFHKSQAAREIAQLLLESKSL